ncbi:MAG: AraC family transcriptional regulator [Acutalibacteraceae bacterium]|nr:AraC family transcriptional regulator [Acutalibacteraceae bacterium]
MLVEFSHLIVLYYLFEVNIMKHSEFIENKQRGSRDMPIQLYRIDASHPEYVMPLHWQKELEIIRVISGTFMLFINNHPYVLNTGDIAFVNCKHLHRGVPQNCRYDCIVVDLSLLNKKGNSTISSYIEPLMEGTLLIRTLFNFDGSTLYATINSLFLLLSDKSPYNELSVIGSLYTILAQLYSCKYISKNAQSKKGATQTAAISEVVDWIEENYTEHITLATLSEMVGMTPNYFCRIFKEYTGKTPIEYVNIVRIDAVCFDILYGRQNITSAAVNNGYNDLSYFCKVFKKLKGISAKAYAQKMHREEK